jgi:hypothetical protein
MFLHLLLTYFFLLQRQKFGLINLPCCLYVPVSNFELVHGIHNLHKKKQQTHYIIKYCSI